MHKADMACISQTTEYLLITVDALEASAVVNVHCIDWLKLRRVACCRHGAQGPIRRFQPRLKADSLKSLFFL